MIREKTKIKKERVKNIVELLFKENTNVQH